MEYVFLGGLVLACIIFLVVLILGIRTWRVIHLLAVLGVYSAAIPFVVYFAMQTKAFFAWKKVHYENLDKAEKIEREFEEAHYGKLESAVYGLDTLIGARQAYSNETVGRGRVWRSCSAGMNGTSLTVQLPTVNDAAGAPIAVNLKEKTPLFLFAETTVASPTLGDISLPTMYLGEFHVTAVQGTQVSLNGFLTFGDIGTIVSSFRVAVYEKLPTDSRDTFTKLNLDRQKLVGGDQEKGIPAFFDPTFVSQLGIDGPTMSKILDNYEFDGLSEDEIKQRIDALNAAGLRDNSEFPILATTHEWEVEAIQDFTLDVDAPNSAATPDDDIRRKGLEQKFFNNRGQAIPAFLRAEKPLEIKKGTILRIDSVVAEKGYEDSAGADRTRTESLVSKGWINSTPLSRRYQRLLKDYESAFRNNNLEVGRVSRTKTETQYFYDMLKAADVSLQGELTTKETEQTALREDRDSFKIDSETAEAHLAKLASLRADREKKINALFLQIQAMSEKKAELEDALIKSANGQSVQPEIKSASLN